MLHLKDSSCASASVSNNLAHLQHESKKPNNTTKVFPPSALPLFTDTKAYLKHDAHSQKVLGVHTATKVERKEKNRPAPDLPRFLSTYRFLSPHPSLVC